MRNSLEQSASSLIVYGRTELEPRTHLGLAACKTLANPKVLPAGQRALAFSASDVRKKSLPQSSSSAPPSRRSVRS